MRIEVNIEKKYFLSLVLIGLAVIGFVGVYAYNSAGNPAIMGHSVNEIDWKQKISGNISADGICIGSDCRTSWPTGGIGSLTAGSGILLTPTAGGLMINATATGGGESGVSRIIGGMGVIVSPAGGIGEVTINEASPVYWFGNLGTHFKIAPIAQDINCKYCQGINGRTVIAHGALRFVDGQVQTKVWFSDASDDNHHCNTITSGWVNGTNANIAYVPSGHSGELKCAAVVEATPSGITLSGGPGAASTCGIPSTCSFTKSWD